MYDSRRLVTSHDPAYIRWNQWIFLRFLENGLAYRAEVTFPKISTPEFILPGDDPTVPGYKGHRVEILAEGQQFVAYGIHPDTLASYQWLQGGPDTVPVAKCAGGRTHRCRAPPPLARTAGGQQPSRGADDPHSRGGGLRILAIHRATSNGPRGRRLIRGACLLLLLEDRQLLA